MVELRRIMTVSPSDRSTNWAYTIFSTLVRMGGGTSQDVYKRQDLDVLMGEAVLQVHRAQDGQSSAKGMPADADVNQLLRNLAVDSLSDRRAFIGSQKAFMNPDFCILVIIGDGLFPEGKIRLPVLGGIGASEADGEASFLFSQIALDPGRAVIDDNKLFPRLTGLDIPIGEGGKLQGIAYTFSVHGIHLPLVYESVME